jgi:hypothetical protein
MPLDTQLAEIILSKGLDKKTNAKLVLNGYLTELENALFTEGGSLSTRPGFQKLSEEGIGDRGRGSDDRGGLPDPSRRRLRARHSRR